MSSALHQNPGITLTAKSNIHFFIILVHKNTGMSALLRCVGRFAKIGNIDYTV